MINDNSNKYNYLDIIINAVEQDNIPLADTYHRLGSILVKQLYTSFAEQSRQTGGELKNGMNFILYEFANFTKIDSF